MSISRPPRNMLEMIGARTITGLRYVGGMTLLLGAMLQWTLATLVLRRSPFGWRSMTGQIVRLGVTSLPIVILVQVFIGVILVLQMTPPLAKWGSENQVAVIIGFGGFRMLGPIITAVVLTGFAGASIAAEIGSMVVAEEIEALESIALNPVRFLVMPRVWAALIVMVLLCVVADLSIAFGGWLTSLILGPTSYVGYWQRMQEALLYRDFYTGLIQAGVFGMLISTIACYEGLKVHGGAEGVGKATTMTVVNSIVAIIISACIFTVVFYLFKI